MPLAGLSLEEYDIITAYIYSAKSHLLVHMSHRAGNMAAFKAAMELAYGPLSVNGDDDSWQPPALPTQPGRQLWTDAFAVLNFITLAKSSSSPREADLWSSRAKKLVQSVHNTLEEKNSDASQSTQGTVTDGLRSGNDGQAGPVSDGLALM